MFFANGSSLLSFTFYQFFWKRISYRIILRLLTKPQICKISMADSNSYNSNNICVSIYTDTKSHRKQQHRCNCEISTLFTMNSNSKPTDKLMARFKIMQKSPSQILCHHSSVAML